MDSATPLHTLATGSSTWGLGWSGDVLASVAWNGKVWMWNGTDGSVLQEIPQAHASGTNHWYMGLSWNEEGSMLATSSHIDDSILLMMRGTVLVDDPSDEGSLSSLIRLD